MLDLSMIEPQLTVALQSVLALLLSRFFPFLVYGVARRGSSWLLRVLLPLGFVTGVFCSELTPLISWYAVGLAYYAALAIGVHLASQVPELTATHPLLRFVMLFALFVAVPGLLLPEVSAATFLVVGWALALKAHSYWAEPSARGTSIRHCLFFFLVDPTLVYVQRGRSAAQAPRRWVALSRIALGALSVTGGLLAAIPVAVLTDRWLAADAHPSLVLVGLLAGVERLLTEYAKHSGVASVLIGLMALCGYRVAECYRYPLLAKNPLDFWARWNTYVGHWAKRYVHVPLAMRLARSNTRWRMRAGPALAAFAVFAAVGLLHDAYTWVWRGEPTLLTTAFFAINAALVLVWHLGRRLWSAKGAPLWGRAVFATAFVMLIGFWP